jgi:hypothetical protein
MDIDRAPRRSGALSAASGVRRRRRKSEAKQRLVLAFGQVSLTFAVISLGLWLLGPELGPDVELLVIAVSIALGLTNLVVLFACAAASADRPDSWTYLAELGQPDRVAGWMGSEPTWPPDAGLSREPADFEPRVD